MVKTPNWLLAVALLALILRLVYAWQISQAPFADVRLGDARAYHEWALRIADGDWLGQGVFYQAPLYPYVLAVVYKVFGDGAAILRFVQAVIGAGSCVLLAAAGMALFGELGVIAGVLLAIYPPAIFFDGLFEKSSLVTFFTAALLYLLASGRTRSRAFLAGVTLGLFALTRENALLLIIPIVAWFMTTDPSPRWHRVAAAAAGVALMLLPVAARNYAVGGGFHLTTSQFGTNFYIGNHAGARGLYEPLLPGHGDAGDERADATRLAQEISGRPLSASEVSSFWAGRAFDFIRSEPIAWTQLMVRKLALTVNAAEIADTESQEVYAEWSSLLRRLTPLGFGVVASLAAFGIAITAREWRRLWFLYAIAIAYALSVALFFVFARYRLPLAVVLMVPAAGGIAMWRDQSTRARRGWAFAALVATAVIAYVPLEGTRTDRITHYVNIGNQLLADSRRRNDAAEFFNRALKDSPQLPAGHYGLGASMMLQQRFREAIDHYQIALAGWPDNSDLRVDYAVALASAGDRQAALDQLTVARSLRADPALVEKAQQQIDARR